MSERLITREELSKQIGGATSRDDAAQLYASMLNGLLDRVDPPLSGAEKRGTISEVNGVLGRLGVISKIDPNTSYQKS